MSVVVAPYIQILYKEMFLSSMWDPVSIIKRHTSSFPRMHAVCHAWSINQRAVVLFGAMNLVQILHEETFNQLSSSGSPLVDALRSKGVLLGVKLDLGTEPLSVGSTETVTKVCMLNTLWQAIGRWSTHLP